MANRNMPLSDVRWVRYEYCISLVAMTLRRESAVVPLPPGSRGFWRGLPYNLLTVTLGWWGVPWGLLLTPLVLWSNCCGGREVITEADSPLPAAVR
jgi:hypothetical protein